MSELQQAILSATNAGRAYGLPGGRRLKQPCQPVYAKKRPGAAKIAYASK
jgi:hypothetical protein